MVALAVVTCVIVPFLYYAATVYEWGHANKPQGYKYPEVKQLWMTGVGMATFAFLDELVTLLSTPICRMLVPKKVGADETVWEKQVAKAVNNTSLIVYFSISTFWGYSMMKHSIWLPPQLGGLHPQGSI